MVAQTTALLYEARAHCQVPRHQKTFWETSLNRSNPFFLLCKIVFLLRVTEHATRAHKQQHALRISRRSRHVLLTLIDRSIVLGALQVCRIRNQRRMLFWIKPYVYYHRKPRSYEDVEDFLYVVGDLNEYVAHSLLQQSPHTPQNLQLHPLHVDLDNHAKQLVLAHKELIQRHGGGCFLSGGGGTEVARGAEAQVAVGEVQENRALLVGNSQLL